MKKIRLRTSLSLFFALMVAITVFFVSVLSGTFINRQFEDYVTKTQKKEADDLAESIGNNYDAVRGGWNIDYIHGMGMYALKDGFVMRLRNAAGTMLWDAEHHDMALCNEVMQAITRNMEQSRPDIDGEFVTYSYTLKQQGAIRGFLEISYYTPYYLDENAFRFISALNMILVMVGLVSLLFAVCFGFIIARRITEPISAVIDVTQKIADGDYAVRARTEQKDRETYELSVAVNHMAEALGEQEYLRQQLTSDIAHELRTPVTNIKSYIEMMLEGVLEPSRERLQSCYEELSRLSGLMTDLERLKNAETGALTLEKEQVELFHLAETILQGFETQLQQKNIEAKILGTTCDVMADPGRIGQLIANLLSNAIKYTDEGGKIEIFVAAQPEQAMLTVADTGIGISEADVLRIFERFYRADKSRNRRTGGAGIGLSISKAIVQAHGGTIRCESEMGHGSRFIVTLPRE